jgi:hypothetical protein
LHVWAIDRLCRTLAHLKQRLQLGSGSHVLHSRSINPDVLVHDIGQFVPLRLRRIGPRGRQTLHVLCETGEVFILGRWEVEPRQCLL